MTKIPSEDSTSLANAREYSPTRQANAYNHLVPVYEARHEIFQPVRNIVLDSVLNGLPTGSTALEVGCGCGASLALIAQRGYAVEGVDFSPEMVAAARKHSGRRVDCLDFMNHTFDRQFDLVFAQAFIHLFPKHKTQRVIGKLQALARLRVFFSTTLNDQSSEGWEQKDGVVRYRSRYTLSELQELIARWTTNSGWRAHSFELMDPLEKRWLDVILTREN
jgi:SAM-dependent methyltransferase